MSSKSCTSKNALGKRGGGGDIFINFTPPRIVLADTWNIIMIILFLDIYIYIALEIQYNSQLTCTNLSSVILMPAVTMTMY